MKLTLFRLAGLGLAAAFMAGSAPAETLSDAQNQVVACRDIADAQERLACYDSAADALSVAVDIAAQQAIDAPLSTADASSAAGASSGASAASGASMAAAEADPDEKLPFWARLPLNLKKEREEQRKIDKQTGENSNVIEVTVVSIQRNKIGRHFIELSDGQVWRQLDAGGIRVPSKLPAGGKIRKSLLGSPWFEFDEHPHQDFKVKRIE